jgi:hypothetical protein
MNQVVAHFKDGRVVKGLTMDFLPNKDRFHLSPESQSPAGGYPQEIEMGALKAVFFVKSLRGDSNRQKSNEPDPSHPLSGKKIQVVFRDGEILVGTTQAYLPGRPGLFVVPVDPGSNNERCYVVTDATQQISLM